MSIETIQPGEQKGKRMKRNKLCKTYGTPSRETMYVSLEPQKEERGRKLI